jgi:hypothetical protein
MLSDTDVGSRMVLARFLQIFVGSCTSHCAKTGHSGSFRRCGRLL